MEKFYLDLNGIKTIDDINNLFWENLNFKELAPYYGGNLNALWDCITATPAFDEAIIEIENFNKLDKEIKAIATQFIDVMKEYEEKNKKFQVKIKS